MSSASKVGELFKAAGQVFCQLGDATAQLQLYIDQNSNSTKNKKRSLLDEKLVSSAKKARVETLPTYSSVINKRHSSTDSQVSDVTLSALNSRHQYNTDVEL